MKIYQKKLLLTFSIIIIFIVGLYFVHYKRYVINAPKTHIEARKDYVNALTIHFFYLMFVKAGIDYQNPIIAPIKNTRDYFYKRGISKLSPIDSERAIWFHVFEFIPYIKSVNGRYGSLLKKYGKERGYKFLDDTFKYIILLADNDPIDKSFKDNKYIVQTFFELYNLYTNEFKMNFDEKTISKNNMKLFVRNKELFERFSLLYQKRENFLRNHDIGNYLKKNSTAYNNFFRFYDDGIYISSMILFYKIKNGLFECERDKKYFKNIFISKNELRHYIRTINKKKLINYEYIFQRLKIPNTRYDKKYSNNPFKMYVNCNYDDIFIKEGN